MIDSGHGSIFFLISVGGVFLQMDLMSSIGESAALGASGAVLWGSSADFTDKVIANIQSTVMNEHKTLQCS